MNVMQLMNVTNMQNVRILMVHMNVHVNMVLVETEMIVKVRIIFIFNSFVV